MKFIKYEGTGNDFIICESIEGYDSVKLCDRHYGIGADGVIVVKNYDKDIVDISIYNADGSTASICGNGLRCVGAYLKQITNKGEYKIRTISGIYKVKCLQDDDYEVQFPHTISINKEEDYYIVNSGNLHVFTINNIDFDDFINKVRTMFDSNVEMVEIINKDTIKIRVNERGVGETLACGSACVAISGALYKQGLINKEVICINKGGNIKVRVEENSICLSGKVNFVYKGEL